MELQKLLWLGTQRIVGNPSAQCYEASGRPCRGRLPEYMKQLLCDVYLVVKKGAYDPCELRRILGIQGSKPYFVFVDWNDPDWLIVKIPFCEIHRSV